LNSICELYIFKKIIIKNEYGVVSIGDMEDDKLKKIKNLFGEKFFTEKSDKDEKVENDILKYLEETTFNCQFENVPWIINNEMFYRDLLKTYKIYQKKKEGEKPKPESLIFPKSIGFVKIFNNYVKEISKKNLDCYERKNHIEDKHKFFEKMKDISEKLLNKLYSYSNINYEAENKICLHLYIMKNIITNYCFFFNNLKLENYIKEFKKFKK
jgi:hypothetical protein